MIRYVLVFDLDDESVNWVARTHIGSVEGLAFSDTLHRFASCSSDCTAIVYDLL